MANTYQQELHRTQQVLAHAQANLTTVPGLPRNKTSKHPDPSEYKGSWDSLDAFLFNLKANLQANTGWYPAAIDELNYAFSRLSGKAEKQILPQITQLTSQYQNNSMRLCE